MFGEIFDGVLAAAERGIHDLLMFGGDVTARFSGDPADETRQPVALGLDIELIGKLEQARRAAMRDQRAVE